MGQRSRARVRAVLALALVATVFLAGCGSSDYRYVSSKETNTFFKVPRGWQVFDEDEILESQRAELSPQAEARAKAVQWVVAFDANPEPALTNVLNGRSPHPTGLARVRLLGPSERDVFSLQSLRTELLKGDPLAEAGEGNTDVEVVENEDVTRPGGLHGTRTVVNIKRSDGGYLTMAQTALVDSEARLVYLLALVCDARCYAENENKIDEVMKSWTIKER